MLNETPKDTPTSTEPKREPLTDKEKEAEIEKIEESIVINDELACNIVEKHNWMIDFDLDKQMIKLKVKLKRNYLAVKTEVKQMKAQHAQNKKLISDLKERVEKGKVVREAPKL